MIQGVQYTNDNVPRRGEMSGYHSKPAFRDFRKGASLTDAIGLNPLDRNALEMQTATSVGAKYGIGFEVEKTRIARGAVREYPLFCGFERDSSCGYEAVTNILPLLPACAWRTKVYDMMHQAERVIDDSYSPSNSSCGGHMTISVEGMSGQELMAAMRNHCGIILALFRGRIGNHYVGNNITMLPYEQRGEMFGRAGRSGWGGKYSVAKVMDNAVEFRIPSRITSVRQMRLRYDLMYVLVDGAVKGQTPAQVRRRFTPIINAMYEPDTHKASKVIELSKSFDKFIATGKVNAEVMPWIDRHGNLFPDAHTRCARRRMAEVTEAASRDPQHYGRVSLTRW